MSRSLLFNTLIKGIALVHWYYFPDSYDEWIPAQDVDIFETPEIIPLTLNDSIANDTCRLSNKKQFRVACRYILDCELFNEWGNELDYEVEQDEEEDLDDGGVT
jgi:SWI/SNF related-matrix-associated actin-dependent regulator of chromatin subfamily C